MSGGEGPGSEYNLIVSNVSSRFSVLDQYLRDDGSVEFRIAPSEDVKEKFVMLLKQMKPKGFIAVLRKIDGDIVLTVSRFRQTSNRRSIKPMIFLLATLGTVSVDGWFRTGAIPGQNVVFMTLLYAIGVMGIIGIHELGHKIASHHHNMSSSSPYFIPGLPTFLPTFGAFITTREPPANRDTLFDLGLSGPIAGLIVAMLVAVGGAMTSTPISIAEMNRLVGTGSLIEVETWDIFTGYILSQFAPNWMQGNLVVSPLIFASSLGFLITFLNLLPAWQLDGGHMARAVLSRSQHRIMTYVSVIVLFLLRFELMALLILFLSMTSREMRPLDDVSSVSRERKIAFISVLLLASFLYLFTLRGNPFFLLY